MTNRFTPRATLLVIALATRASGQAPTAAPVALLIPASTRAAALGNAWVAGRDEFVVFYNPAQITSATGAVLRVARLGPTAAVATLAAAQTVGRVTVGWGAQLVDFRVPRGTRYPYRPEDLTLRGDRGGLSVVTTLGGNMTYRGFRTGLGVKYASDRVDRSFGRGGAEPGRLLLDAGLSRSVLRGTAAFAVTSIATVGHTRAPLQESLGWSRALSAGPLDLGLFTEVNERRGWIGGGGGVEAGYSWIDGWTVTGRAGGRRPQSDRQRPFTLGAGLTADRLSIEYAADLLRGGGVIHDLTIRWR